MGKQGKRTTYRDMSSAPDWGPEDNHECRKEALRLKISLRSSMGSVYRASDDHNLKVKFYV